MQQEITLLFKLDIVFLGECEYANILYLDGYLFVILVITSRTFNVWLTSGYYNHVSQSRCKSLQSFSTFVCVRVCACLCVKSKLIAVYVNISFFPQKVLIYKTLTSNVVYFQFYILDVCVGHLTRGHNISVTKVETACSFGSVVALFY